MASIHAERLNLHGERPKDFYAPRAAGVILTHCTFVQPVTSLKDKPETFER